MDVTDLDVLRVNEAMLAILIGGGIPPQTAAWTIDALFLYVGAYTMEASVVAQTQRPMATTGGSVKSNATN